MVSTTSESTVVTGLTKPAPEPLLSIRNFAKHFGKTIVLRDISTSTSNMTDYPGQSLTTSLDDYLRSVADAKDKKGDDRIGVIGFSNSALIDAMPNIKPALLTYLARIHGQPIKAEDVMAYVAALMAHPAGTRHTRLRFTLT